MARTRLLSPSFFTNEDLAEVPIYGRMLFAGLWTIADREGRHEDRPRRIKAAIFPYDDVDVEPLLCELDARGFIQRYQVDGERYLQITKWSAHQHPHPHEADSKIPSNVTAEQLHVTATPLQDMDVPWNVPAVPLTSPSVSNSDPVSDPVSNTDGAANATALAAQRARKSVHLITDEEIEELVRDFPAMNVRRELLKFQDWWDSAKHNRTDQFKTFRGWLRRIEDAAPKQTANGYADAGERFAARIAAL